MKKAGEFMVHRLLIQLFNKTYKFSEPVICQGRARSMRNRWLSALALYLLHSFHKPVVIRT